MLPIDFLYRGAQLDASAPALEADGEVISYADLVERVDALGAALQSLDDDPAAPVAVFGWNTVEHAMGILACQASGRPWVPLNPRDPVSRHETILQRTRPRVVLADESCLEALPDTDALVVTAGRPGSAGAAQGPAVSSLTELIESFRGCVPARGHVRPDSTMALKFTGGTTGHPKAVVQTHRMYTVMIESYLHHFGFNAYDVNLVAAPLTHAAATFLLPVFAVGGKHVLLKKPSPAEVLEALVQEGITMAFLPPTMIYMLMALPGFDEAELPRFQHLIYGAAPMPPARIREVIDAFGPVLETAYGQVEAPQMLTCMTADQMADAENHGSVGRATYQTEVGIMDREGQLLGPHQPGEIVARGDLVMKRYHENPELTRRTLIDGWLHTGDGGVIDERGFVFLQDRLTDMIISGGFNVYPAEVEAALSGHPSVEDVCVVGVPHEKWGEEVVAAVKLRPGRDEDPAGLLSFARDRVGSVMTPKRVRFVEDLPRSGVGKVLRREVKSFFQQ